MRYCPFVSEVESSASERDTYLVVTHTEMRVNSTLHVNSMTITDQIAD